MTKGTQMDNTPEPTPDRPFIDMVMEEAARRRAGLPLPLIEGCPTKNGESWGDVEAHRP